MKQIFLTILVLSTSSLFSHDSLRIDNSLWKMYPADKSKFMKTDTLNLRRVDQDEYIRHGFSFLSDSTFQEIGGKICGAGRDNYNGNWRVSGNTLILDPKNGNQFKFQIFHYSKNKLGLIQLK